MQRADACGEVIEDLLLECQHNCHQMEGREDLSGKVSLILICLGNKTGQTRGGRNSHVFEDVAVG